jgi:hypothetical protein
MMDDMRHPDDRLAASAPSARRRALLPVLALLGLAGLSAWWLHGRADDGGADPVAPPVVDRAAEPSTTIEMAEPPPLPSSAGATPTGPRLAGKVLQGGVAAAGARLAARLDGRTIGLARCDAEGVFVLPLAVSEARAALYLDSGRTIELEALQPGWQPLHLPVRLLEPAPARAEGLVLELRRGGALLVRVQDANGRPAPGARIALEVRGKQATDGAERWTNVALREADEDGRAALGFASEAVYRLRARADGAGACLLAPERLATNTEHERALVLRGGARLVGVVLAPDGRPCPGLALVAVPQGLTRAQAALREADEDEDGLAWSRVSTDEQGRFEFAGLRPGSRWSITSDPELAWAPGTPSSFEDGADAIVLRAAQAGLALRLRDDEGAPVSGALATLAPEDGGQPLVRTTDRQGRAWFALSGGGRHLLVARQRGRLDLEQRLELAAGTLSQAELAWPASAAPGVVRIQAVDQRGRALSPTHLVLRFPASGRTYDVHDLPVVEGRVERVPAGAWLADLAFPEAARVVALEPQLIELEPGTERQVAWRATVGAAVALRVATAELPPVGALPEDPAAARRALRDRAGFELSRVGIERGLRVRLADGTTESLLLPGDEGVLVEALAEGPVALVARGAAWSADPQWFEVREGGVLDFAPRRAP